MSTTRFGLRGREETESPPRTREGAEQRAASVQARRTRLRVKDDNLILGVPAPGLDLKGIIRATVLLGGGLLGLLLAYKLPASGVGGVGRLLSGFGGVLLLGTSAYGVLRGWLDATTVVVTVAGLEVTHDFPLRMTRRIRGADFQGILIGRRGRVERGYTSRDWGWHRAELVVAAGGTVVHFGAGLSSPEQAWLKETIENRLPPRPSTSAQQQDDLSVLQPPERFWRDIRRYSAIGLTAALVLLALLLAAGVGGSSAGSVLVLALVLATVVGLSSYSFRLERSAGAWHRAVVKYEAALMDLSFSPDDRGGVAERLPDFRFFGGPRRFYNVAWSETDPGKIVLFDYTTSARSPLRDGMGCAVQISKLSQETLYLKPRLWPALSAQFTGVRLPECPQLEYRYFVVAENEGRARNLLGPKVVEAIMSWSGSGPAPHVCIQGGMVGLSMHRRHADSDKAVRRFYRYALTIREAILARLREMRA